MVFPTLMGLIKEVYKIEDDKKNSDDPMTEEYIAHNERYKILVELLKKYNFSPTLQMKKFFDHSGLTLIYNSQKTNEYVNMSSSGIFKECRSVIIDLNTEKKENTIVSSMCMENPMRISDKLYRKMYDPSDVIETGYEGTMINVYHYNEKWHFSTTSCPSIDGSRYFHPTKTHGTMFDEYLERMVCIETEGSSDMEIDGDRNSTHSKRLRDTFAMYLDKDKRYLFVLVHHENRHIIDYSTLYGDAYIQLVHLSTHNNDFTLENLEERPLSKLGIVYPHRFENINNGLSWLLEKSTSYALIVKRQDGTMLKVCREDTIFHETMDLGNANPWHNMLWIYLQNRPDYTVADYAKSKNIQGLKTRSGKYLSPTFVIHNAISMITSYLYKMYCKTTYYNLHSKELIFNGNIDKTLPPLIRFHLVQLRDIQKKIHIDRYLTYKTISHYIRFHQTMKNIRILVQYFANNDIYNMSEENQFCIEQLNELLINH